MTKKNLIAAALLIAALTGCASNKPADSEGTANANLKEAINQAMPRDKTLTDLARQSPLHIEVSIKDDLKVFINDEEIGTVKDTGKLRERLGQRLEERKRAVAADQAGGGIQMSERERRANERVVFVSAPTTFKYGDVMGVIEAIKAAGGDPVGIVHDQPSR